MLSTTENTLVIRNYIIVAASVIMVSLGLSEVYQNPARLAQQVRLDNYSQYLSAGIVNKAQTSLYR